MTPVKPQVSKFNADKILPSGALTCYGGFSHERLLGESSRPYMLAYYLFLHVPLLCKGEVITVSIYLFLHVPLLCKGEVITVSISFNLMFAREKHDAINAFYNL
jgi:hypothetical protein